VEKLERVGGVIEGRRIAKQLNGRRHRTVREEIGVNRPKGDKSGGGEWRSWEQRAVGGRKASPRWGSGYTKRPSLQESSKGIGRENFDFQKGG